MKEEMLNNPFVTVDSTLRKNKSCTLSLYTPIDNNKDELEMAKMKNKRSCKFFQLKHFSPPSRVGRTPLCPMHAAIPKR